MCAVSYDQVADCVARSGGGTTIVSLGAQRLDDVLGDLGRVARACGVEREGERVEGELRSRLRRASPGVTRGRDRARVSPSRVAGSPMLAGHWVPDVIEAAGGVASGPPAGTLSPTRPGTRSPRSAPTSWWWRRAGSIWREPSARRNTSPIGCECWRRAKWCSTATHISTDPGRGWWMRQRFSRAFPAGEHGRTAWRWA